MTKRDLVPIDQRPTVRDPEAAGRFAAAIELSELMVEMKRQQVRRMHPDWVDAEVTEEVGRWRLKGRRPCNAPT